MNTELLEDILRRGEGQSDYAFFYNAVSYISGRFRHTGDLHYCLFRFMCDGRRDRLIRGLLRGGGLSLEGDMLAEFDPLRSEAVRKLPIDGRVLERYQDIWCNGRVVLGGVRQCADRYSVISKYLQRFGRQFSVFDLGGNLGYFSIRIAEDFDAVCVCVESTYTYWLSQVLFSNARPNVYALNHRFTLDDLRRLGESEQFDVVLALSILHHIEAPSGEVLEALKGLGRHVIIELPTEDNACGGEWLESARGLETAGFELLGFGRSHLGGADRPIYACQGKPPKITKAYLQSPQFPDPIVLNIDDEIGLFTKGSETRPFYPGINLHSFLYYGGFHPDAATLERRVAQAAPTYRHNDLTLWNWVLTAGNAVVIDKAPEAYGLGISDALQLPLVKEIVRLCGYVEHNSADDGLQFHQSGNGVRLLMSGWSQPEQDGAWSIAESARVALPGPIMTSDGLFEIALELLNCVSQAHQEVSISINGEIVISIVDLIPGRQTYSCNMPPAIWNLHLPAILEIAILNSCRPETLTMGGTDQSSRFKLFEVMLNS